jgi:16S rRNA pseudouridine516 synthase
MSTHDEENLSLNYAQIVSYSGMASRRDLRKKRVKLTSPSGERLKPRTRVEIGAEEQEILVSGEPLAFWAERDSLWVMHKPEGFVVSRSFEDGESIYSLLPVGAPMDTLEPVGRLDSDTRGLLVFTEDGQLNQRMRNPSHDVPRTYLAGLSEPVDAEKLKDAKAGILELRDGTTPQIEEVIHQEEWNDHGFDWLPVLCPEFVHDMGAHRYLVTITEGRYHEVRRLFAAMGSHVERLQRLRFGPFWLLPRGTDPERARTLIEASESERDDAGQQLERDRPVLPVFLDEGESTRLTDTELDRIYQWFGLDTGGLQLRIRFPYVGE